MISSLMRISRVSKNKDFKNWLAVSAGDEAAGRVNNIPSIIAKALVTEWVMPHWKEMKKKLGGGEGRNAWGWVHRSYRRVRSVYQGVISD